MSLFFDRASVRAYTEEQVNDQKMEALLRAAMAAPSAANQQPWEFYVVRDAAKRELLAQSSPYAKPCLAAPAVVVVCMSGATRFPEYAIQDLSAAVENLLLAAVEEGLGAVWMGIAPDSARMEAVAKAIDLPEGADAFALVSVGYPATEPQPKCAERYDASRVHWM